MTAKEACTIYKRNTRRLELLKLLDHPYPDRIIPLEWYLEVVDALKFMHDRKACNAGTID